MGGGQPADRPAGDDAPRRASAPACSHVPTLARERLARSQVSSAARRAPTGSNTSRPLKEEQSMSTVAAARRPIPIPRSNELKRDPAAQAFVLLRIAFTVAPILFGLDKFANVLTNDWTRYFPSEFNDMIPGTAGDAMHIVGVVEIVAGLAVAIMPRFGGLLVAAWLGGIILNLLLVGGYGDIALRDFGLLLGALTLSRLATAFGPGATRTG